MAIGGERVPVRLLVSAESSARGRGCDTRGRTRSTMTKPLFVNGQRFTWRSAVPRLIASAVMLASVFSPASLAAAAPRDVARKDTLVISGFGAGLTEIQD